MAITITGEAGKPFDEVARDFDEVAVSGRLSYGSMARDTLTFDMVPGLLDGSDLDLPEEGQTMALFFDAVRQFEGTVSTVSTRWVGKDLTVSVTVSGPWFFMESTAMSDLFDAVERPQFVCESGDLRAHIIRFLNRAITLGVPLAVGTIDALYDVPRITLRDGSLAYGLTELVRQAPDAIGWIDYAVAGAPKFHLTRRDPGSAVELEFGVDGIIDVSLEAQYELLVKKVSVPYATRSPEGVTTLVNQESTSGAAGALQAVALSGPELFDYAPPEVTLDIDSPEETYNVTSVPIINSTAVASRTGASNVIEDDLEKWWPYHRGWKARHASAPNLSFLHWNALRNTQPPWDTNNFDDGITLVVTDDDGNVVQAATDLKYAIVDDGAPLPYWLWDELGAVRHRVAGHFYTYLPGAPGSFPDWQLDLRIEGVHMSTIIGGPNNNDNYIVFAADFDVILIDQELTDEEFSRALVEASLSGGAYAFEAPPAGYAQNLRDAQSWLPHKGKIVLRPDSGDLTRHTGDTVNLIGGLPKWETMGALIQGEDFDLVTRQHTLKAGLPARFSGATAATRIESRRNDNLTMI